ncbi:PH domain-containing protein [Flavobacteriaceae bacterium]|nr:PH domain-containing protein [Flavobacteriaceae bacterium]
MHFKSKNDPLFLFVFICVHVLCIGLFLYILVLAGLNKDTWWPLLLLFLVELLFISIQKFTYYEIKQNLLVARSGPIKISVKIAEIKSIKSPTTAWVGMRLAKSRNGMKVRYKSYSEIYISPEKEGEFISQLQKINPEIELL